MSGGSAVRPWPEGLGSAHVATRYDPLQHSAARLHDAARRRCLLELTVQRMALLLQQMEALERLRTQSRLNIAAAPSLGHP